MITTTSIKFWLKEKFQIFGGRKSTLKLVSTTFYQIFIFNQMTALQKL